MKDHLLLTGATGFIGQYLLRRLLLQDIPVVVIARGNDQQSANDRLMSIVTKFEQEEGRKLRKPICFTGDLTEEMVGLDDNALDWFEQNCRAVLHNAASIRFHAPNHDRTKEPWVSNLTGVQNMLELCRVANMQEFHHISTAYVSGVRTDRVLESELDVGQEFVNDYQQSKLEAEKAIHACEWLNSRTIYRPALVVGDSKDGFTTAPDFGLYYYIQFNCELMRKLRGVGVDGTINIPFRLRFTGNECRNIVTVDWVADAIVHILTRPEWHNQTYHLTPEVPCSTNSIMDALQSYFDYDGIQFVGTEEIPKDEQTEMEKLFYDFVETFESYWEDEPRFDRSNTNRATAGVPTPPIDADCLYRLIDYAATNCFNTDEPVGSS
ncbi:MAG: SDR family oxidoreductase [Planctomycetota bacterium]